MAKFNKNFSGIQVTDEMHNTLGTGDVPLEHDTFWVSTEFEVWTGAGQTGTELTQGVDYVFSDQDLRLSLPIGAGGTGQDVYTTVEVLDPYKSVDLYFTYKTVGDYADAADHNDQEDRIVALETALTVLKWKEPVSTYSSLPAVDNLAGDARIVLDTRELYIWSGTDWLKSPYEKIEVEYVAGEDLLANQVAAMNASGNAIVASKDDPTKVSVLGIVKYDANLAQTVKIQVLGIMDGFAGLTAGEKVFLGNSGVVIQDESTIQPGETRSYLGFANDADEIDIRVDEPVEVTTVTNVSVRQTVMNGLIDDEGYPNFLQQENIGNVMIKGASTPCTMTFADGFDNEDGEINYVFSEATYIEPVTWQTIIEDGPQFLYADYDPSTRSISYGTTKVTPFYEDKFYTYRHHLLHLDGADLSTTIIDEYGNYWNIFNSAHLSTTGSGTEGVKFGTACLVLDSTTSDYIETDLRGDEDHAFNPMWPFTIECWFYTDDYTEASQAIFGTGVNNAFLIGMDGSRLRMYVSGDGSGWLGGMNPATGANTTWVNGKWYKLVFEYDGFAYRVYLDGQIDIEYYSTDRIRWMNNVQVGGDSNSAWYLNGGIDEIRITFGSLRYGGKTLVPETSPFTEDANYYTIPEAKMYSGGVIIPNEVVRTYLGEVIADRTKFSLMHFDGTPASTTFTDEYDNRWTAAGNARISPGRQPKFGTAYCRLGPTVNSWVDNTSAYNWGTNWTVELFWFTANVGQADQNIFASWEGSHGIHLAYNNASSGKLRIWLSSNGTSWDIANPVEGSKTDWVEGQYYHICAEYDGTTYKVYVDGISDITHASALNIVNCTSFHTGRWPGASNYLRGGVDELRVTIGETIYGAPFTPPTSELTTGGNTKALLHFNGTDESTTFTDEMAGTWTANGEAQLDTGILPKWGTGFLYCDGSGDYAQSLDVSGVGEKFTLECWFFTRNITSTTGQAIFSGSSDYRLGIMVNYGAVNRLGLWLSSNGSSWDIANNQYKDLTTPWEDDQWYHLCLEFDGEAYYVYLNGVNEITTNDSTPITSSFPGLRVGQWGAGSYYLFGGVEELRLTTNYVRYDGPLTPPTSSFTADGSIYEIINYAFNGRYDSPAYRITGGYDNVYFDHNMGTENITVQHYVRKYGNMYWMPQFAHVYPNAHYGTGLQTIWRNSTFVRQSPTNTVMPYYGGSDSWEGGANSGEVKLRVGRNF